METVEYPKLRDLLLPVVGSRSQQWVADSCGVSQIAVCKWFNGYTRPTKPNLVRLAFLFKKELDLRELAEAAEYDPDGIVRLYEAYYGGTSFLDLMDDANEKVDLVHKLWLRGDPGLAIEQAKDTNDELREALKRYSSPKHRHRLLRVHSKLLLELTNAYSVSYLPCQGFKSLRSVAEEQYSIAEQLGDDEIVGDAYLSWGEAYYVRRKYDRSRWYYSMASEIVKGASYRAQAFRSVALSSAYLGDQKGSERAQNQIKRLVDKGQFSIVHVGFLTEGLARAQALLNQPQAYKTLEEGWKLLAEAEAQGEKAFAQQIQLTRSEILLTLHLERENKRLIEEIGEKGLYLAHQSRYLRYTEEMERLLQEFLY